MGDDCIIPPLPEPIKEAIRTNRMVFFIGSGVSKLMGYPLWNELGYDMLECALEDGAINSGQYDLIKKELTDPKTLLSVVRELYQDKNQFVNRIISTFSKDAKSGDSIIARLIANQHISVVTTNYDTTIELTADSYNVYRSCFDDNLGAIREPFVVHIHGSVDDPEHLIITETQYDELYHFNNEIVEQTLLRTLGTAGAVLFMGYGLSEPDVIRFIRKDGKEGKYYCLKGFKPGAESLIDVYRKYYSSFHVQLIPFILGEKQYEVQKDILESWVDEITSTTNKLSKDYQAIETIIKAGPSGQSVNNLLGFLAFNVGNTEFFLQSIFNNKDYYHWLVFVVKQPINGSFWKTVADSDRCLWFILALLKRGKMEHSDISVLSDKADELGAEVIHRALSESVFHASFTESAALEIKVDSNESERGDYIALFEKMAIENELIQYDIIRSIVDYCTYRRGDVNRTAWLVSYMIKNGKDNVLLSGAPLMDLFNGAIKWYDPGSLSLVFNSIVSWVSKDHFIFGTFGCLFDKSDRHQGLRKIIDFCGDNIPIEVLGPFIKGNLDSNDQDIAMVALHLVNIRFAETKQFLFALKRFDSLNYSELYDLVSRNIRFFSIDDIEIFKKRVIDSKYHFDDEIDRIYKNDLLALLPPPARLSSAPMFLDNTPAYHEDILPIYDRGKRIRFLKPNSNVVPEYESLQSLKNDLFKNGRNHDIVSNGLKKYLRSNRDLLNTETNQLKELPVDFYPSIVEVMCDPESDASLEQLMLFIEPLAEYERYMLAAMYQLMRRAHNPKYSKDFVEVMFEIAEMMMDKPGHSSSRIVDDGFYGSIFGNPFTLALHCLASFSNHLSNSIERFESLLDSGIDNADDTIEAVVLYIIVIHYSHLEAIGIDVEAILSSRIPESEYAPELLIQIICNNCPDSLLTNLLALIDSDSLFSERSQQSTEHTHDIHNVIRISASRYIGGDDDYSAILSSAKELCPSTYVDASLMVIKGCLGGQVDSGRIDELIEQSISVIDSGVIENDSVRIIHDALSIQQQYPCELTENLVVLVLEKNVTLLDEKIMDYILSDAVSESDFFKRIALIACYKDDLLCRDRFIDMFTKLKEKLPPREFNIIISDLEKHGRTDLYHLNIDN